MATPVATNPRMTAQARAGAASWKITPRIPWSALPTPSHTNPHAVRISALIASRPASHEVGWAALCQIASDMSVTMNTAG